MYAPSGQMRADLWRWEGESLVPYRDSLDYWTQGIGRHHGITASSPPITPEIEAAWLVEDIQTGYYDARTLIPELDSFDLVRKEILIALAFNMGGAKLAQFIPFLRYVNAQQWSESAYHLLTNLSHHLTPYLLQTGTRAAETALRIATGEVLGEYAVYETH